MTTAADAAIKVWAEWIRQNGETEGHKANRDMVEGSIHAPGSHSNPVLSEVIWTLSDEEARHASRVDGYIREYGEKYRRVCLLRFVGRVIRKSTGFTGKGKPMERVEYSRPLTEEETAQVLKISTKTVNNWIGKVKEALLVDLHQAKLIRQGKAGEAIRAQAL